MDDENSNYATIFTCFASWEIRKKKSASNVAVYTLNFYYKRRCTVRSKWERFISSFLQLQYNKLNGPMPTCTHSPPRQLVFSRCKPNTLETPETEANTPSLSQTKTSAPLQESPHLPSQWPSRSTRSSSCQISWTSL